MRLKDNFVGGIEYRRRCPLTSFCVSFLLIVFACPPPGMAEAAVCVSMHLACFRQMNILLSFSFSIREGRGVDFLHSWSEAVFISVLFLVAWFAKEHASSSIFSREGQIII